MQNRRLETVENIIASRREVNVNAQDTKGKTAIDISKEEREKEKESWENDKRFKKRKETYSTIVELLESYERNPIEARINVRIKLKLAGKTFFSFFLFI